MSQYVLIFERALESVYVIGPFGSSKEASEYAKGHHNFPQIWRVAELRAPEDALPEEEAQP